MRWKYFFRCLENSYIVLQKLTLHARRFEKIKNYGYWISWFLLTFHSNNTIQKLSPLLDYSRKSTYKTKNLKNIIFTNLNLEWNVYFILIYSLFLNFYVVYWVKFCFTKNIHNIILSKSEKNKSFIFSFKGLVE